MSFFCGTPLFVSKKYYIRKEEKKIIIDILDEKNEQLIKAVESAKKIVQAMEPVICYKNGKRDDVVDSKEYIRYHYKYIKEMDCFQNKEKKWRMLERLQPGERDFNVLQLEDSLFWVYYVFRPIYWVMLKLKQIR